MASDGSISIKLSMDGGKEFQRFVCLSESVKSLTEEVVSLQLFDKTTHRCILVFNGRVLAKNKWPIKYYGIAEGSLVQVFVRAKKEAPLKLVKMVKPMSGFCQEELNKPKSDIEYTLKLVAPIPTPSCLRELADRTLQGLVHKPIPTITGLGGSYFMFGRSGLFESIFKPLDEEPGARRVEVPTELVGLELAALQLDEEPHPVIERVGLKLGTVVGEGYIREAAAYLLDHPRGEQRRTLRVDTFGFSGVPPTCLVKIYHTLFNHLGDPKEKMGSLQMYMDNFDDCGNFGSNIIEKFTAEEVHKIAVLDLRFVNADRHLGNILVQKHGDEFHLIPIDHGYCFPSTFEDMTIDWLDWNQAKVPFNVDTMGYINTLDAKEDIAMLESYGWKMPSQNARIFRTATMMLKKGAMKGLTAYEIGRLMRKGKPTEKHVIENIFQVASGRFPLGSTDDEFIDCVSVLIDEQLGSADGSASYM